MPSICLAKPCKLCGKSTEGANFTCPKCGTSVCFYCMAEKMRAERSSPKCPVCGESLT